jgi:hypothetical protein
MIVMFDRQNKQPHLLNVFINLSVGPIEIITDVLSFFIWLFDTEDPPYTSNILKLSVPVFFRVTRDFRLMGCSEMIRHV